MPVYGKRILHSYMAYAVSLANPPLSFMHRLRNLPALCIAILATALAASVVQTQFNLGALTALGAPVDASTRIVTTLEDLGRFGLVMAAISAGALLPALSVGHVATRRLTARARLAGARVEDVRVLFSSSPKSHPGNNGGALAFLPDGTLVMSVGDGQRREQAQNPSNHIGKLVRLDREGRTPPDNPFVGKPGYVPALYTLGHRNAQGLAFDHTTMSLLLTEHGPRGGDEINLIEAGKNYGWPLATGGIDYSFARVTPFRQLAGFVKPLLDWTPSIAPSGLTVYDAELFAGWRGDLLVPALKERTLRRVKRQAGRIVGQELLLAEPGERLPDVKVAPDGAIHVLTDSPQAKLLRVVPAR